MTKNDKIRLLEAVAVAPAGFLPQALRLCDIPPARAQSLTSEEVDQVIEALQSFGRRVAYPTITDEEHRRMARGEQSSDLAEED